MRIWDLPVSVLCNKHLVGEHYEAHCVCSIITNSKTGFAHHPEVMRWRGRLTALELRHNAQVAEMEGRGLYHFSAMHSLLDIVSRPGPWEPVEVQIEKLKSRCKKCKELLEFHSVKKELS